jgi:hypothetical protein
MNTLRLAAAACAALMIAGADISAVHAQSLPSWEGLVQVRSSRLDLVFLAPGADFRPFNKVMLEPTEVAFRQNWLRDFNNRNRGARRLSQSDADRMLDTMSRGAGDAFAEAYRQAGFEVVQSPGPDVLLVRTGVINLSVTAPDVMTAGRSRTFAREAGEATLVVEARDSQTHALLGRAVDRRIAGNTQTMMRNSVTNQSDFSRLFRSWGQAAAQGLTQLRALSPVNAAGATTPQAQ